MNGKFNYTRMCDHACLECAGDGACEIQTLHREIETLKQERDFAVLNYGRVSLGYRTLTREEACLTDDGRLIAA